MTFLLELVNTVLIAHLEGCTEDVAAHSSYASQNDEAPGAISALKVDAQAQEQQQVAGQLHKASVDEQGAEPSVSVSALSHAGSIPVQWDVLLWAGSDCFKHNSTA